MSSPPMACDKNLLSLTAWTAAIYSIVCYALIFSFELWFIINHHDMTDSIPALGFVLAAVYFTVVLAGFILVLALILHSMLCLTIWLVVVGLAFLPEGGLVLYMSLYKWGIDNRNGQIELSFYALRAVLNVVFVVCVQSLLSQWRTDKQTSTYQMNLQALGCQPTSPYDESATTSTTINPVFKYTTPLRAMPTSEFDPKTLHEMIRDVESTQVMSLYSTQSLDRKAIKSKQLAAAGQMPDDLMMRPTHRPVEYLDHPGSVTDFRLERDRHRYYPTNEIQDRTSSTHSIRDIAL